MRPENIGNISKYIIGGMERSLSHNHYEQSQSRTGSRKGMDVDGYFNVVAQNHGLDIAKAIRVRNEMNEEGIMPDTEEFVELSKKHGVDPDIMKNVVDEFVERYLM